MASVRELRRRYWGRAVSATATISLVLQHSNNRALNPIALLRGTFQASFACELRQRSCPFIMARMKCLCIFPIALLQTGNSFGAGEFVALMVSISSAGSTSKIPLTIALRPPMLSRSCCTLLQNTAITEERFPSSKLDSIGWRSVGMRACFAQSARQNHHG